MTALIIAGFILLLIAVLLCSPVCLHVASRGGQTRVSLRYLFIRMTLFPPRPVKPQAKAKGEAARAGKKKKKEEAPEKKKKSADTLKIVWELVKSSKKALYTITRHLVFDKIVLIMIIGGEEAQQVATGYARARALVENGIALLSALFVVKEPQIELRPDFAREKTDVDAAFRIRIAPFYALAAGVRVLAGILRVLVFPKSGWNKRKKIKGGK